ncbi:hypothetical protein HAX54_039518 [Datura stramonium]|uniref:Uncharacterized protein n=1 Tax=Datura stramonium TaxID=4076 RepID=A0ABS8SJ09_DATST|nr:hypothetical protein [Datura stramonium]
MRERYLKVKRGESDWERGRWIVMEFRWGRWFVGNLRDGGKKEKYGKLEKNKYLDLCLLAIACEDWRSAGLSVGDHHLFSFLIHNRRFTGISRADTGDPPDETPMVF